jgi:hypothetical protein
MTARAENRVDETMMAAQAASHFWGESFDYTILLD